MKILLSRVDNIGDLILALPLVGVIKHYLPGSQVWFLARSYSRAILACMPEIDGFLCWDEITQQSIPKTTGNFLHWNDIANQPIVNAVETLKKEQFDVFINVSAHKQPAELAKKAKIPRRIGTAHRLYHWWLCNERAWFSRKASPLHEMQLNAKLLKPLGLPTDFSTNELLQHLRLNTPPLAESLQAYVDPQRFNLLLHPGSNGNAREWPIAYYAELIKQLPVEQFNIVITGSAQEQSLVEPLVEGGRPVQNLVGKTSLSELVSLVANVNGLVAASTGPLHLAAVLGIPTLGLYPPRKGQGPQRWGPIGQRADYLMHKMDNSCQQTCVNRGECACMRAIGVAMVKAKILNWYTLRH